MMPKKQWDAEVCLHQRIVARRPFVARMGDGRVGRLTTACSGRRYAPTPDLLSDFVAIFNFLNIKTK